METKSPYSKCTDQASEKLMRLLTPYIKRKLKEQRELCASHAVIESPTPLSREVGDAIINAPEPDLD